MPITPRNGASVTVVPRSSVARPSAIVQPNGVPSPNVTPQPPGRTSSMRTTSVCPARAPRTSTGPLSAWPASSAWSRSAKNSPSGSHRQPALSDGEHDGVARVDGEHRREVAREVAVQRAPLERKLVDHQKASSFRQAATTRATDGMYASSIFQYGYGTS